MSKSKYRQIFALITLAIAITCGHRISAFPMARHRQKAQPSRSQGFETDFARSFRLKLRFIEAGEFTMGSPASEAGRREDEVQHKVRLTRSFYIAEDPVTLRQFAQFVLETGYKTEAEQIGYAWNRGANGDWAKIANGSWRNPGFEQVDECPVVDITWDDAIRYCHWLSRKTGNVCRLPTEAEWEYACRAGTNTNYANGDDPSRLSDIAWYDVNSANRTHPVATKAANPWGLHDMVGNVWQWCFDGYSPYDSDQIEPVGVVADAGNEPSKDVPRIMRGGAGTRHPRHVVRL